MINFGIICEFNPLHNGHKRLIDTARASCDGYIVCVMSGNAVQRGELAICDKYVRAEAAVKVGADLVVELPYPWCASGAECFSNAAVKILSHFCNNIIFGSEHGDIDFLKNAAECASRIDFRDEFKERLNNGEGSAQAYFSMLSERGYENISSNDILGIEYIRAASNTDISFYTIKREGDDYNAASLNDGIIYPSATALRSEWQNGIINTQKHIPAEAFDVFNEAIKLGQIVDYKAISKAIVMFFRLANPKDLYDIAEADEGIINRICMAAKESVSYEEMFEALRTKRYTDAKLRRVILFCLTGVSKNMLKSTPQYTTLLGASENGRKLLSSIRKDNSFNIVTKPADAPKESEQFCIGQRLDDIFTLAQKNAQPTSDSYRKKAFIL